MVRLVVASMFAAVLALGGVATTEAAPEAAPARPSPETAYAQQAFAATNEHRADQGLSALRKSRCLQRFARAQARLMAQREQLFHQTLGPIMTKCKLRGVAENVAYGYASGAAVVDNGWMNSEGHRTNILNGSYTLMAIGARRAHDGNWYVAQVFGTK